MDGLQASGWRAWACLGGAPQGQYGSCTVQHSARAPIKRPRPNQRTPHLEASQQMAACSRPRSLPSPQLAPKPTQVQEKCHTRPRRRQPPIGSAAGGRVRTTPGIPTTAVDRCVVPGSCCTPSNITIAPNAVASSRRCRRLLRAEMLQVIASPPPGISRPPFTKLF